MTRAVDPERRAALLSEIVDYVLVHGLTGLSLRPLALAVDSSPRVLLYYFHSKERLITEILSEARARQRSAFVLLRETDFLDPVDGCFAGWQIMSDPEYEPILAFFYEVFGIALHDRKRYANFLHGAVEDWIEFFAQPSLGAGASRDQARVLGTVLLAGFRGFAMDLCATRDRERLDQSVKLWLQTLTPLLTRQGSNNAR